MSRRWILVVIAFAKASFLFSQEKVEKEYRIPVEQVPQSAIEFIKQFDSTTKVLWLQEIANDGISYEAKFKTSKKRYSVEFSQDGILEDIEQNVSFKEIPEKVKSKIDSLIKASFDFYKIEKVQEQYLGSADKLLEWKEGKTSFKPQYELVVKCRNKGQKAARFEFLFDEDGNLLERKKVAQRSDNILRF